MGMRNGPFVVTDGFPEDSPLGGGTGTHDESLEIDYGDHALSPCP
jgi:hypothetical protein